MENMYPNWQSRVNTQGPVITPGELGCIKASANYPSGIVLDLVGLKTADEAKFRQTLQNLNSTVDELTVEFKGDFVNGDGEKWLQIACEELGKNKNIPGIKLDFSDVNVTDATLTHLDGLKHKLLSLDLSNASVTDIGLSYLSTCTELRALNLSWTKVTDAGLPPLAPLTKLQWLKLSVTEVTEAGLPCLQELTQLRDLYLFDTGVKPDSMYVFRVLEKAGINVHF